MVIVDGHSVNDSVLVYLIFMVGVLGLCLAQRPNNSAGVASKNPKQVLDFRSAPTPSEPSVLVQVPISNKKIPKGISFIAGGGTWTRTKDTACIRRML